MRRVPKESRAMIRFLTLLLCVSSCIACDDKPPAPASPAKKETAVRIVSDWSDWKKQDTGPKAKVEVKTEVAETNPPKDVKRAELPAEAKKAGVLVLGAGEPFSCVKYEGKEAILPREGYEISWDAMRVSGMDFFAALTFPVGKPDKDGESRQKTRCGTTACLRRWCRCAMPRVSTRRGSRP